MSSRIFSGFSVAYSIALTAVFSSYLSAAVPLHNESAARPPLVQAALPVPIAQPDASLNLPPAVVNSPLPMQPGSEVQLAVPASEPLPEPSEPKVVAPESSAAPSPQTATSKSKRKTTTSAPQVSALMESDRGSGILFDGASSLPPYLAIADSQHAARLAVIVSEARKSRTGRAILDKMDELVRKGRPVPIVDFVRMVMHGTTPWGRNMVLLSTAHLRSNLGLAAATLIHETRHILQEAAGLPKISELELEAHLDDIRLTRERKAQIKSRDLGALAPKILRKLKGDFDKFLQWFAEEYRGDFYPGSLLIDGPDKIVKALEKQERALKREVRSLRLKLRVGEATIKKMKEYKYRRSIVHDYRCDEVVVPRDRIQYIREFEFPRIRRELRLLRSENGRKAMMAYAHRIKRRALRLRATLLKES